MRDGQISFSVEMGILVIVVLAVLFVIAYHFFPTMFSMSGLLRRILGQ